MSYADDGGLCRARPQERPHPLISSPYREALGLLLEGKVDAYLALPPEPQELHARQSQPRHSPNPQSTVLGRNISAARWPATRNSSQRYPAATKRVVRAMLKAADLCASEPERAVASRRWRVHRAL